MLAGLSPDHYSRLEQGRQHTVTDEVLAALARALRLDEVERAHLRDLAAPPAPRRADLGGAAAPRPGAAAPDDRARPRARRCCWAAGARSWPATRCSARSWAPRSSRGASLARWLFLDPARPAAHRQLVRLRRGRGGRAALRGRPSPRRPAAAGPGRRAAGRRPRRRRAGGTTTASPTGPRWTSRSPTRWSGPLTFGIEAVAAPLRPRAAARGLHRRARLRDGPDPAAAGLVGRRGPHPHHPLRRPFLCAEPRRGVPCCAPNPAEASRPAHHAHLILPAQASCARGGPGG